MSGTTAAPASAERRLLTVMFCDLVGSTALSGRLDPEDLRDLLVAYQRRVTAVVEAAGGNVARYEGDGVLAYFGYPAANEDDADRAVRAGLELAAGIQTGGVLESPLKVRIGIATGTVVVGELLRSKAADNPPVVGETPNLAARLQALADPGDVLICEATRGLTGGLFDYRDLGSRTFEGFARPVQAWKAVRPSKVASRFQALRSRNLPLVGRDGDMATLLERWARAKSGSGQVVLVGGDPGIGKSRIAFELASRIRADAPLLLRYYCSAQHQSSTLHPILEWLRRAARFDRADPAAFERLRPFLPQDGQDGGRSAALIAELLAVPVDGISSGPRPDARLLREVLLEGIAGNLRRLTGAQPGLVVVDDAHWIDPTSRELLDLLVGRIRSWPVMLLVTARHEFQPAWRFENHATVIELKPIAAGEAEELVRCVPGGGHLPDHVVSGIAERADGVPLYLEELTKAVVAGGAGGDSRGDGRNPLVIPQTLHASLLSRLDRLGGAREVASVAAALGRRFTFALLGAVMPHRAEADLRAALGTLLEAELLVQIEPEALDGFTFRHALIQDAAYGTLLRNERRGLHARIARAIESGFPDRVAAEPEVVADHFSKADLPEPATRYWLQAGIAAGRRWALVEAQRHLVEGLKLAGSVQDAKQRERLALQLNMALGPVTMATNGYAARESLTVFERAAPLVVSAGTVHERLLFLLGLFNVRYGRAELAEALGAAREYFALAQRHGQELGRAHGLLGQTYAAMGEFEEADAEFQRSLDVYAGTPEDVAHLFAFGSQHVISLALSGGLQFGLGKPDLGRARMDEAIDRAESINHALSIALARVTQILSPVPGGIEPDLERAEEVVRFCARYGLANFEAWARFAQGAIIARRGDPARAIVIIRAAIDAAEAMNSRLFRPVHLATLAAAYARLGEMKEAFALMDEAIETAKRSGERRADSALHRARGELLAAIGKREDADLAFAKALEIARQQKALAEEDRAARAVAKLRGER